MVEVGLSWSSQGTVKWPMFLFRSMWSELKYKFLFETSWDNQEHGARQVKSVFGEAPEVRRKFDMMARNWA